VNGDADRDAEQRRDIGNDRGADRHGDGFIAHKAQALHDGIAQQRLRSENRRDQ
jgi:hypothetical protein